MQASPSFVATVDLLQFHSAWAWVVIFSNGLAGVWALAAIRLEPLKTNSLWWFTSFAEASIAIQVAMGVGLVAGDHKKPPAFHPFYGFFAIVVVGVLYAYRGSMRRYAYWLYGFGGLFIMGLGIRAVLTAKS